MPFGPTLPNFESQHTKNSAPGQMSATGIAYYGFRYYSPSMGRFLNRDPLKEDGGINIYAMTGNNPIGRWDYLGLDGYWTDQYDDNGYWSGSTWTEYTGDDSSSSSDDDFDWGDFYTDFSMDDYYSWQDTNSYWSGGANSGYYTQVPSGETIYHGNGYSITFGLFQDVSTGKSYNLNTEADPNTSVVDALIEPQNGAHFAQSTHSAQGDPQFAKSGDTFQYGGKTYTYTDNGHIIKSSTYTTGDKAAVALLNILNPISIKESKEYAAIIQKGVFLGGVTFTQPLTIEQSGRAAFSMADVGFFDSAIGLLHTHGNGVGQWTDSLFSERDIATLREYKLPGYLGTPSGDFYRFNPNDNTLYRYDSSSDSFKFVPTTFDPTYNTYVPNDLPRK